jgi:hypothetical protein
MLSDNVAQQAGCLGGFKAAVEVNGCSDVAMPQEAANCLVIAGVLLQVDGGCGMTILMERDPQSGCFLDAFSNLDAKEMRILESSSLSWKQPDLTAAAQ